jgi:hypothetical protein
MWGMKSLVRGRVVRGCRDDGGRAAERTDNDTVYIIE